MRVLITMSLSLAIFACQPMDADQTELELTIENSSIQFSGNSLREAINPSDTVLLEQLENPELVELRGEFAQQVSTGTTQGASLPLGAEIEAENSGKFIEVVVIARSRDGSDLNVAYSTAEVGNSGWQTLELSEEFQEVSFQYSVPSMVNGNNDFIGFVPTSGTVQISAIGIRVLSEF